MVTVVLPEFVTASGGTAFSTTSLDSCSSSALLFKDGIVTSNIRYHLAGQYERQAPCCCPPDSILVTTALVRPACLLQRQVEIAPREQSAGISLERRRA